MATMKKIYFFILVIFPSFVVFSGCAKMAHLEELLRLKGYSDEKDRQHLLVGQQNKSFERLLAAARSGALGKYPDQKSIWKSFGQPVFKTHVIVTESAYEVWMYRYSTKLFGSDKVYLYFDQEGRLKIYDYSPGGTLRQVSRKESIFAIPAKI